MSWIGNAVTGAPLWQGQDEPQQTSNAYNPAISAAAASAAGLANAGSAAVDAQQTALAQALAAQAAGGGPNLANAQLQQATQANAQAAAGAVASQKGINPGLQARQIQEQTAQINQGAAQQSSVNRMQQQLAAQSQLGQALAAQRQGEVSQQAADTQLLGTSAGAQNQQNAGALGQQQLSAQGTGASAQLGANLFGDLLGGAGSAASLIPKGGGGGGGTPNPVAAANAGAVAGSAVGEAAGEGQSRGGMITPLGAIRVGEEELRHMSFARALHRARGGRVGHYADGVLLDSFGKEMPPPYTPEGAVVDSYGNYMPPGYTPVSEIAKEMERRGQPPPLPRGKGEVPPKKPPVPLMDSATFERIQKMLKQADEFDSYGTRSTREMADLKREQARKLAEGIKPDWDVSTEDEDPPDKDELDDDEWETPPSGNVSPASLGLPDEGLSPPVTPEQADTIRNLPNGGAPPPETPPAAPTTQDKACGGPVIDRMALARALRARAYADGGDVPLADNPGLQVGIATTGDPDAGGIPQKGLLGYLNQGVDPGGESPLGSTALSVPATGVGRHGNVQDATHNAISAIPAATVAPFVYLPEQIGGNLLKNVLDPNGPGRYAMGGPVGSFAQALKHYGEGGDVEDEHRPTESYELDQAMQINPLTTIAGEVIGLPVGILANLSGGGPVRRKGRVGGNSPRNDFAKALARRHGRTPNLYRTGGPVPGRAQVPGDSPRNDTVPTMLSPGEIVIPRSVALAPDAPDRTAAFVAALQAKRGRGAIGAALARGRRAGGR